MGIKKLLVAVVALAAAGQSSASALAQRNGRYSIDLGVSNVTSEKGYEDAFAMSYGRGDMYRVTAHSFAQLVSKENIGALIAMQQISNSAVRQLVACYGGRFAALAVALSFLAMTCERYDNGHNTDPGRWRKDDVSIAADQAKYRTSISEEDRKDIDLYLTSAARNGDLLRRMYELKSEFKKKIGTVGTVGTVRTVHADPTLFASHVPQSFKPIESYESYFPDSVLDHERGGRLVPFPATGPINVSREDANRLYNESVGYVAEFIVRHLEYRSFDFKRRERERFLDALKRDLVECTRIPAGLILNARDVDFTSVRTLVKSYYDSAFDENPGFSRNWLESLSTGLALIFAAGQDPDRFCAILAAHPDLAHLACFVGRR
jgi:hypothetical protein